MSDKAVITAAMGFVRIGRDHGAAFEESWQLALLWLNWVGGPEEVEIRLAALHPIFIHTMANLEEVLEGSPCLRSLITVVTFHKNVSETATKVILEDGLEYVRGAIRARKLTPGRRPTLISVDVQKWCEEYEDEREIARGLISDSAEIRKKVSDFLSLHRPVQIYSPSQCDTSRDGPISVAIRTWRKDCARQKAKSNQALRH